jgi:hypothetical protein
MGRKININLKQKVQQDTKSNDDKFIIIYIILYGIQNLVIVKELFKAHKQ